MIFDFLSHNALLLPGEEKSSKYNNEFLQLVTDNTEKENSPFYKSD